jgi:site-specific recombinase XerD
MRGIFEKPKGSGIYWINYYDSNGVRHREKIGKQSVAEQAYMQRREEVREGRFVEPRSAAKLKFSEIAEARMQAKEAYLAPASLRSDRLRLKLVLDHFGEWPVQKITPEAIDRFLATIRAPRKLRKNKELLVAKGSTANRYRSLLSSIFSFAIRSRKMTTNPCAQVQRFKEAEERVRFLDAAEEEALRKVIRKNHPDLEAEFDLALNTGMRRGEQFNITWDKIDLERGILEANGKTGRRFIPINAGARAAILQLHSISNGSQYVCPAKSHDGQKEDWRRWFEECVTEAGIDAFRWHDLRHTFASRLVMAGVDLRTVQKLLGHSTITTTMKYAHVSDQHLAAAVATLGARPAGTDGAAGANHGHLNGTKRLGAKPKISQAS